MKDDSISRRAAIDALWKALYEFEDKTEKKFQESDELNVEDWIQHRIFVQNMSDIDRQTIMDMPSAQPEVLACGSGELNAQPEQRWIPVTLETLPNLNSVVVVCGEKGTWDFGIYRGWYDDIHSWIWKNKSIKHVHWWMYKDDALPEPCREEGDE